MSLIVALPFHPGDAVLMHKNLIWQRELCGQKPHTAVLCCDSTFCGRRADEVAQAATRAYAKVLRYKYPPSPQNGWPQGPNWAFQHTAVHMQQYGKPWLWMEPDAIPVRTNWLEQLEDEYERSQRLFMGYIVPDFGHMNGVGVYPTNTPALIPRAMHLVDSAWDCGMREEMIGACHHTRLIGHMWGEMPDGKIHHRDGVPPRFNSQASMKRIPPEAVLVHRDKFGLVIDRLREKCASERNIPLNFCGDYVAGPKVEIFIVSYSKDLEYLRWNLKSIEKFASGFSGVTLLVPTHERELFTELAARYSAKLKSYDVPKDEVLWHLAHQKEKCCADQWCLDADFIFHTDSDCIFTKPATPETFFHNGKPILCIESFDRLNGCPWKPTVDAALGINSTYETMRRHGAVHYRGLYAYARARVEKATGTPFEKYVLSCKPTYPWFFTEFNVLGNVALFPQWKDKYHFVDFGVSPPPPYPMIQFWSHSPPDQLQSLPSGGTATPAEVIQKALA